MTHDPLCICADDDYRCRDCYADDCSCGCYDIRRVRPLITNVALDAAREAVRHALGPMEATDPGQHDAALAAIDALRGEQ